MPSSRKDETGTGPIPPASLSSAFVEELDRLNDEELREAISYEQALLNHRTSPPERIEIGVGEELLAMRERDGYTEVIKRQPCPEGCDDCPHGPYLYHVQSERQLDGGNDTLHWSFLGRVNEKSSETSEP